MTPGGRAAKEPNWPAWTREVFTEIALRKLDRAYEIAKKAGLHRSTRVSAEDMATAAVGIWLTSNRADLFLPGYEAWL